MEKLYKKLIKGVADLLVCLKKKHLAKFFMVKHLQKNGRRNKPRKMQALPKGFNWKINVEKIKLLCNSQFTKNSV